MTKMEDESDESESELKDDPSYSEVAGTSADDQAGPSGVGKDGVEAPLLSADRTAKQNPLLYSCCKCKAEFDHLADLSQHIVNMCFVKRPSPMITHPMNRRDVIVPHKDIERDFFRARASKRVRERRTAESDGDLEISQILPNPTAMISNPECMDSTSTNEKVGLGQISNGPSCQSSSCSYCHKSFSTNCDLKRHLSTGCETFLAFKELTRSSLNQKHVCKYCLFKFKSAYSLKTHKLTYGKFCKANRQYVRLQKVAGKARKNLIIKQRLPVSTDFEPTVQDKTAEKISENPPSNQSKVSVEDPLYKDLVGTKILECEDHPNIISVDVVKQDSNEQASVDSKEDSNIRDAAYNPTDLPVITQDNVNPTSDASCDTFLVPSTSSGDTSNAKTCTYCHQSFSFYYKLKNHMSKSCPTGLAFKKKHRVTLFQKNICKYCTLKFRSSPALKVHMLVYCKFFKTKKLNAKVSKKKNQQKQRGKTRKIAQKKENVNLSKKTQAFTNSKCVMRNNIQEPYSVPTEAKKAETNNSDQFPAIVSNTSENNSSRILEVKEVEQQGNNWNVCNPPNPVESVITIKNEATTEVSENKNSITPNPAPVEVTEISGKDQSSRNDKKEISKKSIIEPARCTVSVDGRNQEEASEANSVDLEQINIKLEPDQDVNFEPTPTEVEEITCADICDLSESYIKFEEVETPTSTSKCDSFSEPNDLVKLEPEEHQERDVTLNAEPQLATSWSSISTKTIENRDLQQNRTESKGTFQNSVFKNMLESSKLCTAVDPINQNTKSAKDVKIPEVRPEAKLLPHKNVSELASLQDESETPIKLASESSELLNQALAESGEGDAQRVKAGSQTLCKISHTAAKENIKSQQMSTEASSSNFEKTEAADKDAIIKCSEPPDTIAELSMRRSTKGNSKKATLQCSKKEAKQPNKAPSMSGPVKSKTEKLVAKGSAVKTSLESVNLENSSLNTVAPSILSTDCSNQTDKLSSNRVPTAIGQAASKNKPVFNIHGKKNDPEYDNKKGECLQQTTKILDNNTVELAPQQVQRNVSLVSDSKTFDDSVKATQLHISKLTSGSSKKLSQKTFSDEQDKLNAQLRHANGSSHSTPETLSVTKTCSNPDGAQQSSKSLPENNEKKPDKQDVSNTPTSEPSIKPSNKILQSKLVCPFCNEEKTSQSDLSTHKMLYCKMANRIKIALKESIKIGAVSVSSIDTNTLVPVIKEPESSDVSKVAVCDKLNSLKESIKFGAVPVSPTDTNPLVPVIKEPGSSDLSKVAVCDKLNSLKESIKFSAVPVSPTDTNTLVPVIKEPDSDLSKSAVCDNKEKCRVKEISHHILDKACYICGSEFYNITALRKHQSKYCKIFYNPNAVASNNIDSLAVNSALKAGEVQQTKDQNLRILNSQENVKGKHTTSEVAAIYPESAGTSSQAKMLQEGSFKSFKAKSTKLPTNANVRKETLCNICGYQFGSGNTVSSSGADQISKGCRCMDNILLNMHQEYSQPLVDAGTKEVVDKGVVKVENVDSLDILELQPNIATEFETIDSNQEGDRKFYKRSLSVNNRPSETVSKVPSFKKIINKSLTSVNLGSSEVKKSSHTQVVFDLRDTLNKKSFKVIKSVLPDAAESKVNTPGEKTGNSKPSNANSAAVEVSCLSTSSSDPETQINTLTDIGTKNQVDLKLHSRKLHTEKLKMTEVLKTTSLKETLDRKGAGELDANSDPSFSRLHKDRNELTPTSKSSSSFEISLPNVFSENSVKRRPTLYCEQCGTSIRKITELDYPRCGHKETILKCTMCKYQYPNINKLICHMDAEHSDNELIEKELRKTPGTDGPHKYYCCFCGFSYTLIKNLVNHMTERHKFFHRQSNKNVLPPIIYPSDTSIKGFACTQCDNTVFLTLDSLFDHEDRSKCHKKNCRLFENLSRNYNPIEEQKFEHICFICNLGFISFRSQQIHLLESSRHEELEREAWDSARLERNRNRQEHLSSSSYPKRCFSDTTATNCDLRMTAKVAKKSPGKGKKYSTSTSSRILIDPNRIVLKSDNNEPIPVIDLGHNEVDIEELASDSVQAASLINDETELKPATSEVASSPALATSFTLNTSDLLRILQDTSDADFDACVETANGKADKPPLLSECSTKENDHVDSLMQKMHFGESETNYQCFGCREFFRSQHLLESHSCNGPF